MDFKLQCDQFLTDFHSWIDELYRNGFEYEPVPVHQFVNAEDLLCNDETERKDTLFLWIAKAVCNIIPPHRVYALQGSNSEFQNQLDGIMDILARKNNDYGNAALSPNLFYRGELSPADGILIRLGDKISRLETIAGIQPDVVTETERDTTIDFIGYSILLYIALFIDGWTLLTDRPNGSVPSIDAPGLPVMVIPNGTTFAALSDMVTKGRFAIYQPSDSNEQD